MARKILLTGRPGVGKTTLLVETTEELEGRGLKVGGMVSREVRVGGVRVGFEISDLASGQKGWLAHVEQPEGPQIGKYRVNLKDLVEIGVNAINRAADDSTISVVAIDEIGPMELSSEDFKKAVEKAVEAVKPLIGTIHFKARSTLIDYIRSRPDVKILEITHDNRSYVKAAVLSELLQA
jgi:nucleoside-triphosphatase